MKKHTSPYLLGFASLGAVVLSLVGILAFVHRFVSGRQEYQSIAPFVVGAVPAILVGTWLVPRLFRGWKKHIARGIIYVVCLSPLPCGSEGTLLPGVYVLLFPPLSLMFPHAIILTFAAAFLASFSIDAFRESFSRSLKHEKG